MGWMEEWGRKGEWLLCSAGCWGRHWRAGGSTSEAGCNPAALWHHPPALPPPGCRSVMPQDHFNYAATWWTLSAATLALGVKAIRQGVKAAR